MRTASFLIASLVSLIGCTIDAPTYSEPEPDSGGEPTDARRPDAPTGFHVGGTVDGLWMPSAVALRLQGPGVDELLSVTANGVFTFPQYLADGDSYTVSVQTQPPSHSCGVQGGTGVVAGADVLEIEVRCAGPIDVEISTDLPVPWVFEAHRSEQAISTSILSQAVAFTVVAADATAISVDDRTVASGGRADEIGLGFGSTSIEVDVRAGELVRTWTFTIARGATAPLHSGRLKAPAPSVGDGFARALGASVDGFAIGANYEDGAGVGIQPNVDELAADSGALQLFDASGAIAYLKASNTGPGDHFATAVSMDGDTIVVGARYEDSDGRGVNVPGDNGNRSASGAVYIFRRSGETWVQEAFLKSSNSDGGDTFGAAVKISGDVVLVGAPGEDSASVGVNGSQSDNSLESSGAAYVFRRIGTSWSQEAYLKASNPDFADMFGTAVAVHRDTIVVATVAEAGLDNSAPFKGSVYVFRKDGNLWAQEARLEASNAEAHDRFGADVAVWEDTIAVGAYNEDGFDTGVNGTESDNSAEDAGAAYVFRRTGTTWTQEAYVKASNTGAEDAFGAALALRGDLLLVGAPGEASSATGVDGIQTNETAVGAGAAYVFVATAAGWEQVAYLKSSNTDASDGFGASVALTGRTALIGAPGEDSATASDGTSNELGESGAAYVIR